MKFKFAKTLLVGSIFALGSIGVIACGGDSSSSAEDDVNSSASGEPLILSSVSEVSPLAEGSSITANVASDGNNGYYMTLQGSLTINNEDSPVAEPEGYEGEDRVYYTIDSLQFNVGDKDGNRVSLPVLLKPGASFGKDHISLISVIDDIPLNQDAACGDNFTLFVTVFMSGDEPDTEQFAYTARLQTNFTVPCKVIESSSAAAVCTEMEMVGPVVLSNKLGNSQNAINFSTGTADAPDVTMTFEGGEAIFTASAGVTIAEEKNMESGVTPEGTVCMENFAEAYNGQKNPMPLEQMAWYLVTTSTGTYPVMINKWVTQSDIKGDVTITYYKKK